MHQIQMPTFSVEGKVAVITGSGSGIGRAAALELSHYGAKVIVADIDPAAAERTVAEIRAAGGCAEAVAVNIADEASVDALVARTVELYGGLDIFLANAGIGGEVLPLLEQTNEEFDKVSSVNLKGAFLCGRSAARQMIAQGRGGRIVVTSSIAAVEGGGHHGPYAAAKGGLCSLVRVMAHEWAPHRITVNAVCPGLTDTGITEAMQGCPEVLEGMIAKIPLGRMAKPEEIASAMLYLCTEAAGFITGSIITADGGATIGG